MTLIGIPTLNGPDRLYRLLCSIKDHTDLKGVQLTVSDDCSSPENLQANEHVCREFGALFLTTEVRLGISKQWNKLVHSSIESICVLVNDDIEVVADWLDVLVFTLTHNPHAGMVSLACDTGVTKETALLRSFIDFREARLMGGQGTLLSSGGPCFAFRRADYDAVGGFDERYFCYYEELDLGVSMVKQLNRFHYISEYPAVYHMGGVTMSTNSNASRILAESRQKFWEKWGQTLDQLREEFSKREEPKVMQWHSQWKNWRLP